MQTKEDVVETLRATMSIYRELVIEANDRAASFKAEAVVLGSRNKALEAEIEKFKAEEPATKE